MAELTRQTWTRGGWRPDLPDHRDQLFALPPHLMDVPLPKLVNLTSGFPAAFDQGHTSSCTGNAISGAVAYDRRKQQQLPDFIPSRLFIYYNERVIERSTRQDAGAMIRDGIKSVAAQGVCDEVLWPFKVAKLTTKPVRAAYTDALKHKVGSYQRVGQTLGELREALATGFPIVFGFSVYASLETAEVAKTGVVPMPDRNEKLLGGHAVVLCGYDDASQRFRVRNSWGVSWGQAGYFTIPYDYLTNPQLAGDFWVLQTVTA